MKSELCKRQYERQINAIIFWSTRDGRLFLYQRAPELLKGIWFLAVSVYWSGIAILRLVEYLFGVFKVRLDILKPGK